MNPRNNFINRERRTMYYRKLFISNLDPVIRNSQLNELFSRIGKLITCYVNFDSEGNSLRNAKVEYKYPQDARRAIYELNNAQVGKYNIKVKYERVKKNLNRNGEFNKFRIINRNTNFKRANFIQPKNNNNRRMVIRRRRK
jgi:RNA recognition motif-containing protein